MHVLALPTSLFIFHQNKKNLEQSLDSIPTTFALYFSTSDEFHFLVLVLMPRFLKADFLQEEIIRIANFFSCLTCLCNSNQDPAQEL